MIFVDEATQKGPDGNQEGDENWEHDFHRVRRAKVYDTENNQADQLHKREKVNGSGGHTPCVVIHRVQS